MNESTPKQTKPRGRWARVGLNLLLMAIVASVLGWLAFIWLDVWTGHGDVAIVPDVTGKNYTAAIDELRLKGFEVVVSDSTYDSHSRPGDVIDQNPRQNAKVKPGRLIYLTINALSPKTVTIPHITEISARQARAILEGLGITDISEEQVISEFEGLVLGATTSDGKILTTGARVPVNAGIILQVGSGTDPFAPDSLSTDSLISPVDRYDLF